MTKSLAVAAAACLSILLLVNAATAGSFSEKLRRFILGPDAETYALATHDIRLDEVAERCVHCHDGIQATHIAVKGAEAPMQIRGSQSINHPVGMPYDRYAQKDPKGYRPRNALQSSIQLVDGKVTCISCHTLKKEEGAGQVASHNARTGAGSCLASGVLTAGPKQGDLCRCCHIK
jgi:hypothetical protein